MEHIYMFFFLKNMDSNRIKEFIMIDNAYFNKREYLFLNENCFH